MKFILTYCSNLSFTEIQAGFSVLFCTLPVIVYNNAETDKSSILSDNKGKAGVYQWKHNKSGKIYIGSAFDLSKRLKNYFNPSYLELADNYIARALLLHKYPAFSLTILEYIDITHLSKEDARNLILEREQLYLDTLNPDYNVLKTAGSRLGSKHSEESIAKMSGQNNHMFGKSLSSETLALMSEAKSGDNNPMFGKYKKVFLYTLDSDSKGLILYKSFNSRVDAIEFFDCSPRTISNYLDKNKLYKKQWILSSTMKEDSKE